MNIIFRIVTNNADKLQEEIMQKSFNNWHTEINNLKCTSKSLFFFSVSRTFDQFKNKKFKF